VCNPLGNNTTTTAKNGLVGTISYLPGTSPQVQNYVNHGAALSLANLATGAPNVVTEPATLFLSQVDVPTEQFSAGFPDSTGKLLSDDQGSPLIEYFALHLQSNIMLNATDAAGEYQFAILSDDGSIMQIAPSANGTYSTLIDNDGTHPNALGCAANSVMLMPGVPVPIKLDYFQGPRYSISFILLWRTGSSANTFEPECGVNENDSYYFNEATTPSTPTSKYEALLSRGWSVVPAANFYLPGTTTNPCASPSPSPTH
jgi:hypothetical protein